MEKEQVAVDEAVETVVEQNARGYSKTVWNESTPITADKLNKIENGIASALPLTGGTMTGSITLPNSTKGQIKQTLTNGTTTPTLYITNGDNLRVGSADISNVCIYSKTNPKTAVDGSTYTLYHTGNKPKAGDIGALSSAGGTMTGNIAFENFGGGALGSNIHNLALHSATGNGQMLNVGNNNSIYVGNPNTPLALESNVNPKVSIGGSDYYLYHTGNKPTANDVGALPIGGGTLTGVLKVSGYSKNIEVGVGPGDVYIHNSSSGAFLQLKDDGILRYNNHGVYHEGFKPAPWDIGAMAANNPSFEGNMVQHGPNGRNWIYHINADRGTLHIAPHNNGNPDWSKQIMFDRNGFMYCNVGRKVPTWDGDNPTHHMFRYGSGLGGANGYITFSY